MEILLACVLKKNVPHVLLVSFVMDLGFPTPEVVVILDTIALNDRSLPLHKSFPLVAFVLLVDFVLSALPFLLHALRGPLIISRVVEMF